jgi:hypothetical protein
MHSDDPMAQPNRNVIISLHPLDFKPELSLTEDAYVSQSQQTFIPNVLPVVVGSRNWITPPYEMEEYFFPQESWIIDAIHQKILPLEGHVISLDFSNREKLDRAKKGI